jgi:hypothetical protein
VTVWPADLVVDYLYTFLSFQKAYTVYKAADIQKVVYYKYRALSVFYFQVGKYTDLVADCPP